MPSATATGAPPYPGSGALRRRGPAGPPGRGRALVALLLISPPAIGVSVESGAALAVAQSNSRAAEQRATGDYRHAVATDRTLARRTGPLYGLARGPLAMAQRNADADVVAWAEQLARDGDVEQALAIVDQVQSTALGQGLVRERARLLITGTRAAMAAGDAITALQRTDQLSGLSIPPDLAGEVDSLTGAVHLAAAPQLLLAGRAAEAVDTIEAVVRQDAQSADGRRAAALLPRTLLDGARVSLTQYDVTQAATLAQRLQDRYPQSPEARGAATMLARGQPVSGTVVQRDGTPAPGAVRLAGHFVQSARGDYASGPLFNGRANETGDFTLTNVPVGGPYVLEIQRDGIWVTPVDRESGLPTYQATVTPLRPVDLAFVILPA